MALITENYDQLKIDKLKLYLQSQAERSQPRYYEIYVDALKAVPRTNDATDFDSYEHYLSEDTEKIRIVIYSTHPTSPRNDQYVFVRKQIHRPVQENHTQAVNGLGELQNMLEEKMQLREERWINDQLRRDLEQLQKQHQKELEQTKLEYTKELSSTKEQLEEAEDYVETLEKELEKFRSKKLHLGNVNLGEVASVVVEGIVRRNPHLIAKIPGAEALAGIIEEDNKSSSKPNQIQKDTEVSFSKGSEIEDAVVLSEEEKQYLNFMRSLAESFSQTELGILTHIITKLEEDTSQLKPVAELLGIEVSKS